jgi:transketolase
MAVGAAIAERIMADRFGNWTSHKIYTFISDGGIQEEISQGAGRIAGYLGLGNLVMFFDSNTIQLSTETSAVTIEDTAAKYRAWGWSVFEINGNDQDEIRDALNKAISTDNKPVLIIGNTVMGKGCVDSEGNSFENQSSTHGQPVSKAGASFEKTILNLGGDPANPISVFSEVKEYYDEIRALKVEQSRKRVIEEQEWRKANPNQSSRLDKWLKGELPGLDFSSVIHKVGIASRAASGNVLAMLAENLDNMLVMSADLANSDKTDSFLKKSKALARGDFSGAFLHAGVSELTMAALANGIALHGGFNVACGTFFVFSDYMKPAVRLAALMKLPVIYIWTHDAFRVGEDGPTHQPVEHEAQIRLMEQLRNHDGKPSMLVLRPADSAETSVAWKMALDNSSTPTALLLSRQNIPDIPPLADGGDRYVDALGALKGAYTVMECEDPDLIMVGNGSEVATLYAAASELKENNKLKIRVVSAPSEGLFRQQDKVYQDSILPAGVPAIGLTAGLPATLERLVGQNGHVLGLDHFGYSAPAGVLDKEFGFTPSSVISQVKIAFPGLFD